jgi:N-acetylmuramoyl-L-alanine amidase
VIGETDYKKACEALGRTYATDPVYGEKLITIIEAKRLAEWDKEGGTIMGKKIFIDDGHGGTDNGATGNGILEDAWNLEVCALIEAELTSLGHSVKSTRSTDVFVGLSERAVMANNWGADIFVSCHVNAGGGTGYEDFIYNGVLSSDGNTPGLQQAIHSAVAKVITTYGLKDRGMKRANYAVLRETYMPAILLEAGFLDNTSDAEDLKNGQFKKDYAHAVVVGIQNYFGLSVSTVPASSVSQVVRTRVPVTYNATVTAAGFSIDSAPWGEPGFTQWGMTDTILGNSIYVYEESESGEYVNAYQVGWIDKRAIIRDKQVVASILHLPNGQNWTTYPTEGPYTAGDVISLDGANGESAYTVLGDRNGGKVLIVELENFGQVGIYYDGDKGAKIEKHYA